MAPKKTLFSDYLILHSINIPAMAEHLGVTRSCVAMWASGSASPSAKRMWMIEEYTRKTCVEPFTMQTWFRS